MSDLKSVLERRRDIAAQRAALDSEDADLATAERVLRKLTERSGRSLPVHISPMHFALPTAKGQTAIAVEVLPTDGTWMHRDDFRRAVDARRPDALTDNAFATMLSRLTTGGYIERDGHNVRLKIAPEETGGSNVKGIEML